VADSATLEVAQDVGHLGDDQRVAGDQRLSAGVADGRERVADLFGEAGPLPAVADVVT
jgi:hypothetical protein